MSSIRRILLRHLFGGALVLLLAGAAFLYVGVRWLLTEQFDATLRAKLGTLTTVLEQEGWDIELALVEKTMPELDAAEEPDYFEIWLQEGSTLYRSPSLGEGELPRFCGLQSAPLVRDLELPDGRAGRAIGTEFVVQRYEPGAEDPGPAHLVLVLAQGRATLDRALAILLGGTLTGILLLLGAGMLLVRSAVRRGLLPVLELARHVSAIEDPSRAQRFPTEGVPAELAPLADGYNELLQRIRRAFERERRTTANIAHELRTPVTELVVLAETAERYADDPTETARKLVELREIAMQMSSLISTLLELARMESGRVPLEIEPIDLAEIVRESWKAFSFAADARGLAFTAPRGEGPFVRADRVALSILLANLLSNAVDHAPEGDVIDCEIGRDGEGGFLVLSNSANGLSADDLDKLSEPFWRTSKGREDRAHAGLGLSLVARLAALLELELSFTLQAGVFRARLGFAADPAAPPDGGAREGARDDATTP